MSETNETPTTQTSAQPETVQAEDAQTTSSAPVEQKPKPAESADVVVLSRTMLNYLVIGVTFLIVGMIVGVMVYAGTAPAGGGVDEAQVERIIREYIRDNGLGDSGEDMTLMADDDPFLGPEDAPVVIVEFSAYACPYCGRHFEQTLQPLLDNYGEHIRYVYRDFPSINPNVSFPAALAANCAEEQNRFWEYHEILFENQQSLGEGLFNQAALDVGLDMNEYEECYESQRYYDEVNADFYDGVAVGVNGTPSFLINGQFYSGAQPYEFFERIVQRELSAQGIEY